MVNAGVELCLLNVFIQGMPSHLDDLHLSPQVSVEWLLSLLKAQFCIDLGHSTSDMIYDEILLLGKDWSLLSHASFF